MPVVLRADHAWLSIGFTPTTGPHAKRKMLWRQPFTDYFSARASDATFVARCGLPAGKTVLTLAEMRRYVLPVAEQDWRSFCHATGPDPRRAPVLVVSAAQRRATELLDGWWVKTHRTKLKGAANLRCKFEQVKRWLDARPASDLLALSTYEAPSWVRAVVVAWGGSLKVGKRGRSVLSQSPAYHKANVWIRDWRRTTATRWDDAGLDWNHRVYLLGHAGAMTNHYSLTQIETLRRELETKVWRAARHSKQVG